MVIAVIFRYRSGSKIFGFDHTATRITVTQTGNGEFSGFLADRRGRNAVRLIKILIVQILMDPSHNGFPQGFRIGGVGKLGVVIVAAPYHAGIIRRISGK